MAKDLSQIPPEIILDIIEKSFKHGTKICDTNKTYKELCEKYYPNIKSKLKIFNDYGVDYTDPNSFIYKANKVKISDYKKNGRYNFSKLVKLVINTPFIRKGGVLTTEELVIIFLDLFYGSSPIYEQPFARLILSISPISFLKGVLSSISSYDYMRIIEELPTRFNGDFTISSDEPNDPRFIKSFSEWDSESFPNELRYSKYELKNNIWVKK